MTKKSSRFALLTPFLLSLAWAATTLTACQKDPIDGPKYPAIDVSSGGDVSANDFHKSADLASDYDSVIMAHYNTGVAGTFSGERSVTIGYRVFKVPSEKAGIVLVPGRTEPIMKYAETIWDLNKKGYSVYAISNRGQGESGRQLSDRQIGYVDEFSDYTKDLHNFIVNVFNSEHHPKRFILAHSMGSAISIMYLHAADTGQYAADGSFDGAALSSPAIGFNTAAIPQWVSFDLTETAVNDGKGTGDHYVPGHTDFDPKLKFSDNGVTSSEERFNVRMKMFLDNPELQLGGVSYRWLNRNFKMSYGATKPAFAAEVTTRMIVFEAPGDTVVIGQHEVDFCNNARACQLEVYPTAQHDIFGELDEIRNDALAKAVRFFEKI